MMFYAAADDEISVLNQRHCVEMGELATMSNNFDFRSNRLEFLGGKLDEFGDAASLAAFGTIAVSGQFVAVALSAWPAATFVALGAAPPAAVDWRLQQETFRLALEQARIAIAPPRHEQLIAASQN